MIPVIILHKITGVIQGKKTIKPPKLFQMTKNGTNPSCFTPDRGIKLNTDLHFWISLQMQKRIRAAGQTGDDASLGQRFSLHIPQFFAKKTTDFLAYYNNETDEIHALFCSTTVAPLI